MYIPVVAFDILKRVWAALRSTAGAGAKIENRHGDIVHPRVGQAATRGRSVPSYQGSAHAALPISHAGKNVAFAGVTPALIDGVTGHGHVG